MFENDMFLKKVLFRSLLLSAIVLYISAQVFIRFPVSVGPPTPLEQEKRLSSDPFISGDSFRKLAQFWVDELQIPFDPKKVKNGDIIFVKADLCDYFFSVLHPEISSQYILISHNSDVSVPGKHGKVLDDEKLIAWFGQNITLEHPKLIPIPIGLANRY